MQLRKKQFVIQNRSSNICRRSAKIGKMRLSGNQILLDMRNLFFAMHHEQKQRYEAIKNSQIFSDQRKETFVRFNYRNVQTVNVNYKTAFQKIVKNKQKECLNLGTMNVNELWSQSSLQQLLGNMPYPQDRLKILRLYQKNKSQLLRKNVRLMTT